jgi:hypothetical protein
VETFVDIPAVLSGASFLFTSYFWFIKARKEKPHLQFYQLSNFRSSSRRNPEKEGKKRLCLQQLDTGGVLIVNHSTRQNSVILFECFLQTEQGLIRGDWGYSEDDKPPWNIGPESTIAISPACFFDVAEDFEVTDDLAFSMRFVTASGKHFSHRFTKLAPRFSSESQPARRAA